MRGLISVLVDCRFLTPSLKEQVPELFLLASQDQTTRVESPIGMRQIKDKSDLLSLYFEVLTTDMPFRNFTLRLYTRMLQVEDNLCNEHNLTPAQEQQLKKIFFSSVQTLGKLYKKMYENVTYLERWRPELWLYENLVEEFGSFVPPEQCPKAEFARLLGHPAIILRFIPETAFNKGARSLPA